MRACVCAGDRPPTWRPGARPSVVVYECRRRHGILYDGTWRRRRFLVATVYPLHEIGGTRSSFSGAAGERRRRRAYYGEEMFISRAFREFTKRTRRPHPTPPPTVRRFIKTQHDTHTKPIFMRSGRLRAYSSYKTIFLRFTVTPESVRGSTRGIDQ